MTLRTHNRLMLWGFLLGYAGLMGGFVGLTIPFLEPARGWSFLILLALVLTSAVSIAVGKLSRLDPDIETPGTNRSFLIDHG